MNKKLMKVLKSRVKAEKKYELISKMIDNAYRGGQRSGTFVHRKEANEDTGDPPIRWQMPKDPWNNQVISMWKYKKGGL